MLFRWDLFLFTQPYIVPATAPSGWFRWDVFLFDLVNHGMDNRLFDVIMPLITCLGLGGVQIPLLLAALLVTRARARWTVYQMMAAFAVSGIACQLLKSVFRRPRPPAVLPHVDLLVKRLMTRSFPSGHTTTSFALAMVLAINSPRWAAVGFLLAATVGFSRVYVGVHFPSDVLGGVVVGSASGWCVSAAFRRRAGAGRRSA